MAYTTPRTWATSDDITAARLNQDLRDNVAFLATPPSCRVYNSSNISHISSGATQFLTFNSERFDSQTLHSTASLTGRITAPVAATYMIGGHVEFAANATGQRGLNIRVNGTTTIAWVHVDAAAASTTLHSIVTLYPLAASDYVELGAYQNSGGSLNINATSNYSPEFWMTWVSL